MPQVNSFVGAFHDAVLLYALALNETLSQNGSITDGEAITKRMWNRTFEGNKTQQIYCSFALSLFPVVVCIDSRGIMVDSFKDFNDFFYIQHSIFKIHDMLLSTVGTSSCLFQYMTKS